MFDIYSKNGDIIYTSDRDRIERVLFNLLSNALKFTHPYGTITCKSMIEMHNRTIKVESKINEGTSFILNIPIPTEKVNDVDIFASVQNKNTDDILKVEYSDFSNYI